MPKNKYILPLAFIGTMIVSVNIFGGFAVTRRMLGMFKKQGK